MTVRTIPEEGPTLDDLRHLPPVVDLLTAARMLGIGRTSAYNLARQEKFPCRVIRVGSSYRVPTADLCRLLGVRDPAASILAPSQKPSK